MDDTGEHGIIAAPTDQGTGNWSYISFYVGTNTNIGTGRDNTIKIQSQGGGLAAMICDDLVLNEYDDWFLPSKDELNELYKNRTLIGGFAKENYWSSSEYSNNSAWSQDFSSGIQDCYYGNNLMNFNKSIFYRVRAIRTF